MPLDAEQAEQLANLKNERDEIKKAQASMLTSQEELVAMIKQFNANVVAAESWLKVASSELNHPDTATHHVFIRESLEAETLLKDKDKFEEMLNQKSIKSETEMIEDKEDQFLSFFRQAARINMEINELTEKIKSLENGEIQIDPIEEDAIYQAIKSKLTQLDQLITTSDLDSLIPAIQENSLNRNCRFKVNEFIKMHEHWSALTNIVDDYIGKRTIAETFIQLYSAVNHLHAEIAILYDRYNQAIADKDNNEADRIMIAMDDHFQKIVQLMKAWNGETLCALMANSTNTELQAIAESLQKTIAQWQPFSNQIHDYITAVNADVENLYNNADKLFTAVELSANMLTTAGPNESRDEIYKIIYEKLSELDELIENSGGENFLAQLLEYPNPEISNRVRELQEKIAIWKNFATQDAEYGAYVAALSNDAVYDQPAAEQVTALPLVPSPVVNHSRSPSNTLSASSDARLESPSAIPQYMNEKKEKRSSLNLMQEKMRSLFSKSSIEGQCKKLDEIIAEIQTTIDKMQSGSNVYDAQKKLSVLLEKYENEHNILNKLLQKNAKPLSADTSAKVASLNLYHKDNIAGEQLKAKHLPSLESPGQRLSPTSQPPKDLTRSL